MSPIRPIALSLLLSTLCFTTASARATPASNTQLIEVPVEALLAPPHGYDDNDNIQVVVHGFLPNACYTIAQATTTGKGDTANPLQVHQYAYRDTTGYCASDQTIPAHLQMLIPFTTEIALGQRSAGDLNFTYLRQDGTLGTRSLQVDRAKSPSVDEKPYAAISNATVRDITNGATGIRVLLTGVLNATCTELDSVDVKKDGDVFVILPVLKVNPDVVCAQVLVPFEKTLNLGRQKPGHYLIHVRSMNGKAVNRVTEVAR